MKTEIERMKLRVVQNVNIADLLKREVNRIEKSKRPKLQRDQLIPNRKRRFQVRDAETYNRAGYPRVLKILSSVLDGTPTARTFEFANSTFHKAVTARST